MKKPKGEAESKILVVLPDSVAESASASPLFKGILPVATGFFPKMRGHFVDRKKPLADAILIYCAAGRGWIQVDGGRREAVEANEFAFIPAQKPHAYAADEASPWSIHWSHIRGSEIEAYREAFGISENAHVLSLATSHLDTSRFDIVHSKLAEDYTIGNLLTASVQVRALLSDLYQIHTRHRKGASADPIEKTIRWMRAHLQERLALPDFARKAGLSVAQYSSTFRKKTGYPPVEFYLRLKIQHACRLLDGTPMRIEEIANTLGYEDPYYFSRLFRRIMNKSPRAYRNAIKG